MLTVWEGDFYGRFGEQGHDKSKYLAVLMKATCLQANNKGRQIYCSGRYNEVRQVEVDK